MNTDAPFRKSFPFFHSISPSRSPFLTLYFYCIPSPTHFPHLFLSPTPDANCRPAEAHHRSTVARKRRGLLKLPNQTPPPLPSIHWSRIWARSEQAPRKGSSLGAATPARASVTSHRPSIAPLSGSRLRRLPRQTTVLDGTHRLVHRLFPAIHCRPLRSVIEEDGDRREITSSFPSSRTPSHIIGLPPRPAW